MNIAFSMIAADAVLFVTNVTRGAEDAKVLEKSFEQHVKPFLKQYCVRCHNAEKMKSGIRVDHLNAAIEDRHLRLWEDIDKQLSTSAMPPEGEA